MVKNSKELYTYLSKNNYILRNACDESVKFESKTVGDILEFSVGNPNTDYHRDAQNYSEIILSNNKGEIGDIKDFHVRLPTVESGKGMRIKNDIEYPKGYMILYDGTPMSKKIEGKDTPHVYAKDEADIRDFPKVIEKICKWYWEENNYNY